MPMKAVVDANAYAATSALDFIIRFGFTDDGEPGSEASRKLGALRMVTFSYTYVDEHGKRRLIEVSIPVLSLIPIPMLEVKLAHFDYSIRIVSQERISAPVPGLGTLRRSDVPETRPRRLLAVMAPLDTTSPVEGARTSGFGISANMRVRVEVEKSDLPAGILQLLNLGQEATRSTSPSSQNVFVEPDWLEFSPNGPCELSVCVLRPAPPGVRQEPVAWAEVGIEVRFSDDTGLDEAFKSPIRVKHGRVIGRPTRAESAALTAADGMVIFELFPEPKAALEGRNGFVTVTVCSQPRQSVYFKF